MTAVLPPPTAPETLAQIIEAYHLDWPAPATIRIAPAALDDSTLAAVMRRLFDPRDREQLTVSAFASSL